MMSLWSLLTPRARMRRFALLDAMGTCRALREARELRSQWLGQTLPLEAMVAPRHIGKRPRPALAA